MGPGRHAVLRPGRQVSGRRPPPPAHPGAPRPPRAPRPLTCACGAAATRSPTPGPRPSPPPRGGRPEAPPQNDVGRQTTNRRRVLRGRHPCAPRLAARLAPPPELTPEHQPRHCAGLGRETDREGPPRGWGLRERDPAPLLPPPRGRRRAAPAAPLPSFRRCGFRGAQQPLAERLMCPAPGAQQPPERTTSLLPGVGSVRGGGEQ